MPQPSGQQLSICIVRLSAIGDVCHVTAVVQAIQRHYPNAVITWIVGRLEYTLLSDLPGIEFLVFDKSKGLGAYREIYQQLKRRSAFDVVLHMQTSLRSNLLGALLRAKRKIGLPTDKGKELHRLAITENLPPSGAFHVIDVFKEFAYAIGVPPFTPQWAIPLPHEAQQKAQSLGEIRSGFALLAPSASNKERIWRTERYARIAEYCHEKGLSVIVSGSKAHEDIALAESICGAAKTPITNLTGETTLKELTALCRYARVVIGPDSGTLHLASTQNTPAIGLYAHSNPMRTGPYHSLHLVANAYARVLTARGLEERADAWGYRLKGAQLMDEITVQEVCSLIETALKQPHLPSHKA